MIADFPLTALATLAALAVYFLAGIQVAGARRKHAVQAPAISGPPAFERAFRAHQNVLEWLPLFLPALWLFAFAWGDMWAAIAGFVWSLARLGYVYAYAADGGKRAPYFFAQMIVFVALWIGALIGVIRLWL